MCCIVSRRNHLLESLTAGTDVVLIHERLKLAKVDYEVRYGQKS